MPYFKGTDNTVHFIEAADFSYLLPAGCVEISDEEAASLQNANQGGPIVPDFVSMRQGREALIRRSQFAVVEGAIAGMAGIEGDIARNEWNTSQVIQRNRPLTLAMAQIIGLAIPSELDEWFIYASTL